MNKSDAAIFLCKAIENVAIVAGATIASIYFSKPAILLFLLIVPLNGVSIKHGKSDDKFDIES